MFHEVRLARHEDLPALVPWLAHHAGANATGCLRTWSGQGSKALACELHDSLGLTQIWALAFTEQRLCGALGVSWTEGRAHGWLRGPIIVSKDKAAALAAALAMAKLIMGAAPPLASLSAFPKIQNENACEFLAAQGLSARGPLAHVYDKPLTHAFKEDRNAEVRPLRVQQLPSFHELFLSQFPNLKHMSAFVEAHLRSPVGTAFVGALGTDAAVDGFVIVRRLGFRGAELVALAVEPQRQGKGLGRKLINAACYWATGSPRIELSVLADAALAVKLYERCGWRLVGTGIDFRAEATSARP